MTIMKRIVIDKSRVVIAAEQFLSQVEINENYPVLLLMLLTRDDAQVPMNIKLAAAINLKNLIKRNWMVVSCTHSSVIVSIAFELLC